LKLILHIEENISNAFDLADTLLIQLDDNMLGYLLINQSEKKIFSWKIWQIDSPSELNQFFAQEFMLLNDAVSVKILNYTPRYSAFPADISLKNTRTSFWELSHGMNDKDTLLDYIAEEGTIFFMHAVQNEIYASIEKRFSRNQWISIQHISFLTSKHETNSTSMEICFFNQKTHIVLNQKGKVLFSQAFSYDNPEDLLWHLLNIIHVFGFSANEIVLYPHGLIDTQSSIFDLLNQYFNCIDSKKNHTYQMPTSDITLSAPTIDHIDRILTCVL